MKRTHQAMLCRTLTQTMALALVLCLCCAPVARAIEKSEIVYVKLAQNGAADGVYVVNRFEAERETDWIDYGAYARVTNLTDTTPLTADADSVRLTLPAGTLFYQGNPSSLALPWTFGMEYALDGAPIAAAEAQGCAGALEMRLRIAPGDAALDAFYAHYMLSITVTLDANKCRNIVAENATVAHSGEDQLLTYTVLPKPDTTYVIRTDVTDFALADIQINGVPMGIDLGEIELGAFEDKLDDLQLGIAKLDSGTAQVVKGTKKLAAGAGTLLTGATALTDGAARLKAGMAQYAAGLDQTKTGSAALAKTSAQIVAAIDAYEKESGGSDISIQELRALCARLNKVIDELDKSVTAMNARAASLHDAALSLQAQAGAVCKALSSMQFSESDISALRTLKSRASGNADASKYLSGEIAALGRVLDGAENVNRQTPALLASANETLRQANALVDATAAADDTLENDLQSARAMIRSILSMLDAMEQAGAQPDDKVLDSIFASIRKMHAGIQSLDAGVGELQTNFTPLQSGATQAHQGAEEVEAGLRALDDGLDALQTGAKKVDTGANTLENRTGDIDTQVEEGIDEAIDEITGGAYTPVSYMDARNPVALVQFVIRLSGVKEPDAKETATPEAPEKNFAEKLLDLFS